MVILHMGDLVLPHKGAQFIEEVDHTVFLTHSPDHFPDQINGDSAAEHEPLLLKIINFRTTGADSPPDPRQLSCIGRQLHGASARAVYDVHAPAGGTGNIPDRLRVDPFVGHEKGPVHVQRK